MVVSIKVSIRVPRHVVLLMPASAFFEQPLNRSNRLINRICFLIASTPIGIMVQGSLLHAAALPAYDCVLPFLFPLVQELIGFID